MIAVSPWSICLTGKSMDWNKVPRDFPSIAVNTAIKDAPFCDYWCSRDKPNEYNVQIKKDLKRLRPAGIFTAAHLSTWQKWAEDEKIGLADIIPLDWISVSWIKGEVDLNPKFSVFLAMVFAISRGAKFITLHGCDMAGEGYHDPDLEVRTQDWPDRWTTETNIMKKMLKACYVHGIRIAGIPNRIVEGVYQDYGIILGGQSLGQPQKSNS